MMPTSPFVFKWVLQTKSRMVIYIHDFELYEMNLVVL